MRLIASLVVISMCASWAAAEDRAAIVREVTEAVEAKYRERIEALERQVRRMSEQQSMGVAVVDLQAVARAMGRDADIQKLINDNNAVLLGQLKAQQQKLKMEAGAASTPEQQQALENQLREATQKAEQQAGQFRTQLLQAFRTEVQPAAQKVAISRGAHTVIIAAEPLLSFDSAADITAQLIEELKANPTRLNVPPAAGGTRGLGAADGVGNILPGKQ